MKPKAKCSIILLLFCIALLVGGCGEETNMNTVNNTGVPTEAPTNTAAPTAAANRKEEFAALKLAETLKKPGLNNPLMTQRLGADPYALVYDGRLYIYMTGDVVETNPDGTPRPNTYQKINTINVISTDDMVNWTDHGSVLAAGSKGAAKWGGNSWAPAAACKEINGTMKFFLYFANSGNGIGVLSADSPIGPFTDPINKALISRQTPNCANVEWLFDPAVWVDEDGSAYIYFGGGVPRGQFEFPGTARMVKLGADMISIEGEPVAINPPFLFEDSGINHIGNTYYYSYCSNFNVDGHEHAGLYNLENGQICYMTSDSPYGPFTYQGAILKNPGAYFGCGGNNHHCIFEFNGKYYITYHSQILDEPLGTGGGYRCTHIDEINIREDGSIEMAKGTKFGVAQLKNFDPYQRVSAATMWTMGGLQTCAADRNAEVYGSGAMAVCGIDDGDWMCLSKVDFGDTGATEWLAEMCCEAGAEGTVAIRIDSLNKGEDVGYLEICPGQTEMTANLLRTVTGVHDLYFIFKGNGYRFVSWQFR